MCRGSSCRTKVQAESSVNCFTELLCGKIGLNKAGWISWHCLVSVEYLIFHCSLLLPWYVIVFNTLCEVAVEIHHGSCISN